jgi:hypothetical protein
MLVSSTSMNAAMATTTAINQGLNRGTHTAGAAAATPAVELAGDGLLFSGVSAMSSDPAPTWDYWMRELSGRLR